MPKKTLTQEYLLSLFDYIPGTGELIRKPKSVITSWDKRWNTCFAGKVAGAGGVGTRGNKTAWYVSVDGHPYVAHRLIWIMVKGSVDDVPMIDHKNRDSYDNRWLNLQASDNETNQWNRVAPKNSTTGVKGVSWCERMGKYKSAIRISGSYHHLGYHATKGLAALAHAKASVRLHGRFSPYLNR